MRAIRCLTLLLTLIAPAAFAAGPYQVEMILVRQNAVPAITSPFAPEDWSAGAPRLTRAPSARPAWVTKSPACRPPPTTPCCCTRPGSRMAKPLP